MITIKHPVDLPDTYPLERIGPLSELLFFDIETTGFSGDTSQLYLIGCTYHDGFGWRMIQWFADRREAERELLTAFFTFLSRFRTVIHFNGDGLYIPYLLKRCRRLGLDYSFDAVVSVDIYKKIKPCRTLLGLESLKQKSIEHFLGIRREDTYSGGQLIDVYQEYLLTHEEALKHLLILHNEDDLKGMPSILPILNYADLLTSPLRLVSRAFERLPAADAADAAAPVLSLAWEGAFSLPVPLECRRAPVSLELHGSQICCSIWLYEGELKYFYPNYQDYYYLPQEDTAVHKSVGEYVERSARKRATARTCYTKKAGLFLPQTSNLWEPALREDYKSSLTYVPYEPSLLEDRAKAERYARQLLSFAAKGSETEQ